MTVSTIIRRRSVDGTGANTPIPTGFVFFSSAEVLVVKKIKATGVYSLQAEGTNYSVTGGGTPPATGTVTPIDGATDFPATVSWTVYRSTPLTQSLDYLANDSFPAETHEAGLDRLTLIAQEGFETDIRNLRFPITEHLVGELPPVEDRASKALTFDATGLPTATEMGTASGTTVIATGSTTERTLAERFADTINVLDYDANGDGATDDTAAIQAALDAAKDTGMTVYFPAGNYKVTENLFARRCTLKGDGVMGRLAPADGSTISITGVTLPALRLGNEVTITGITFYYPNQVTTDPPTAYPATISLDHKFDGGSASTNCTIYNNTFVNSYIVLDTQTVAAGGYNAGYLSFHHNRACAISQGIIINWSPAEIVIADNMFGWGFWFAAGAVVDWISSNSVCLSIGDALNEAVEGLQISNNQIYGFNKAIENKAVLSLCRISDNMIDGCYKSIDVNGGGTFASVVIADNNINTNDPNDALRIDATGISIVDGGVATSHLCDINSNIFGHSNGDHILIALTAVSTVRANIVGNHFHDVGRFDAGEARDYLNIELDEGAGGFIDARIADNFFVNSWGATRSVGVTITNARDVAVVDNFFSIMKECVVATDVVNVDISHNRSLASVAANDDMILTSVTGTLVCHGNSWSCDTVNTPPAGPDSVASVAALELPASTLSDFMLVTGTADITSIAAASSWRGRQVTLQFSGIAAVNGVVHGGNLKLLGAAGAFAYAADDTLTLICDGTDWYEITRSVN